MKTIEALFQFATTWHTLTIAAAVLLGFMAIFYLIGKVTSDGAEESHG